MDHSIPEALAGLLGLARRAGILTIGTRATLRALARRSVTLVILASDASPRTVRHVRRAATTTPVAVRGSMESLGATLGCEPIAVIGLLPGPLASRIAGLLFDESRP